MALYLKGRLLNIYKRNDFTNKSTGEVQEGSHILQLQDMQNMADGSQRIITTDLSTNNYQTWEKLIGKDVSVPVDTYAFVNKSGELISGIREL